MSWVQVTGGVIAEGLRAACVAGAVILCALTHSPLFLLAFPPFLPSINFDFYIGPEWPNFSEKTRHSPLEVVGMQ